MLALTFAAFAGSCSGSHDAPVAKPLNAGLQQVLGQVADERGIPPPADVRAGSLPRDDVRTLLSSLLTDGEREAWSHQTQLYRLLGLIGPEDDYERLYLDFAANALIGFYEPTENDLWLVDAPPALDFESLDVTLRSTVAHEFVHALQDARFDVPALVKRAAADSDWSLALSAVLEGDAVYYERAWATGHLPGSDAGTTLRTTSPGSIPAALERELRFPYESGLDWVTLTGAKDGNAATAAVLSGRRITTAEILHPGLTDSGWKPREVSLPDISAGLGAGWKHAAGGSFGEFRLRNFLQLHLAGLPAVAAATGWAGDRFDAYQGPNNAGLAAVRVQFASEGERAEFEAAMAQWFSAAGAENTIDGTATFAELPGGRFIALTSAGDQITLIAATDAATARTALRLL